VVNSTDIDLLNEQINEYTTNVMMQDSKSCSSSLFADQNITFSNIQTEVDFNVSDIDQFMDTVTSFDCVQASSIQNDVAQEFQSTVLSNIDTNYDSSVITDMLASATSSADASGLLAPSADATSVSKNVQTTNIDNDTKISLSNVIRNSFDNNFTSETIQDCINTASLSQDITFSNISTGGNLNVSGLSQDMAATVIAECTQMTDAISEATSSVVTALGATVETTSTTKAETTMTADSTSSATSTGISGSCPSLSSCDCCGCGLGSGYIGIIMGVVCLIVVIALLVGGYYLYQKYQADLEDVDLSTGDGDGDGVVDTVVDAVTNTVGSTIGMEGGFTELFKNWHR
jgi:hypothetical protein